MTTVARCYLCWATFESEMDLLRHEAAEDDRLYFFDMGEDASGPGPEGPEPASGTRFGPDDTPGVSR